MAYRWNETDEGLQTGDVRIASAALILGPNYAGWVALLYRDAGEWRGRDRAAMGWHLPDWTARGLPVLGQPFHYASDLRRAMGRAMPEANVPQPINSTAEAQERASAAAQARAGELALAWIRGDHGAARAPEPVPVADGGE